MVNKQKFDIKIYNIQYVPGLTTNILSISQLIKTGNHQKVFNEKGCDSIDLGSILVAQVRQCLLIELY